MSTIRATYVQHGSSAVPNITLNASGQVIVASGLVSSGTFAAPSGTAAAPGVYFDSDTDTGLYSPGANQVAISTNGTRRFNVASDGTIHIGNGTVNAAGVGAGPALSVTGDAPEITLRDSATGNPYAWMATNDTGSLVLAADHGNNAASSIIDFRVDGTEYMRLDSSGRLLVGTSSAQGDFTLQIQGDAASAAAAGSIYLRRGLTTAQIGGNVGADLGSIDFGANDGTIAGRIECLSDATWSSTSDTPGRLVFSTTADGASSPTEQVRIDNAGFFYSYKTYSTTTASAANVFVDSNGSFNRSTSSIKYKTDIEAIDDSYSDRVLDIRPVWYRSTCEKDCPDHSWWGFIAEEVAQIDPRLVHWKTVEISYDENGSALQIPCEPEPEGVAYDRFVPHLLNLIKRQKEQIEAMEARLTALESA